MKRFLVTISLVALLALAGQSFAGWLPLVGASACVPATAVNEVFTTGSMPSTPVITFTRASSGSYYNSSNVLLVFGATTDAARFDYTISGSTATLLYEPAATNIALQSNAFTTTWTAYASSTITAAATTSPDGTSDGWSIGPGTSSYGTNQTFTYASASYVASLYLKQLTSTVNIVFDLAGNYDTNQATTAAWVRNNYVATASSGTHEIRYYVNGSSGSWYQFGAQVELTPASLTTSGPTSYIPTTTATVTRAADQATFTIPSCVGHLTVTFIDNTTQSIAVSAGSYTLTNTLNEYNIKSIVGAS
jgi:hypothetical protein